MSSTDEPENLLNHLTERINANGWRVISKPTPRPEADELKTLFQRMQGRLKTPGRRKNEEPAPPEAA